MWKALGNEREACFCFHKQLQRFHPTACLGGGWLECESFSYSTLSGFHLLCWCGWFRLRSVDSLCFLWHNSDCAQEWLSQLHLARQVFELLSVFPRHIRLFASDLHWKISTRLWKWHNINMSCLWVTLQLKIVIQLAIIINVPINIRCLLYFWIETFPSWGHLVQKIKTVVSKSIVQPTYVSHI